MAVVSKRPWPPRPLSLGLRGALPALFSLLVFTVVSVFAAGVSSENRPIALGRVNELNDVSFEEMKAQHPISVVIFHTPWCSFCAYQLDLFESASPALAENSPPIFVGKIDSDKYKTLSFKNDIRTFPSIKLFIFGQSIDIQSADDSKSMVALIRHHIAPNVTVLDSEESVKKFVDGFQSHELGLFLSFGVNENLFTRMASKFRGKASFGFVTMLSEKLMVEYDFDKSPALVSIHSLDEIEVFYGPFEEEEVESFIRLNYSPLIIPIKQSNIAEVSASDRLIALIIANFDFKATHHLFPEPQKYLDDSDSPAPKSIKFAKRCKLVARAKRNFRFAYVDAARYEHFVQKFVFNFSLKNYSLFLPTIVVWDGKNVFFQMKNSSMLHDEDMEFALTRFLQDIENNKIQGQPLLSQSILSRTKTFLFAKSNNLPILLTVILFGILTLSSVFSILFKQKKNSRVEKKEL